MNFEQQLNLMHLSSGKSTLERFSGQFSLSVFVDDSAILFTLNRSNEICVKMNKAVLAGVSSMIMRIFIC